MVHQYSFDEQKAKSNNPEDAAKIRQILLEQIPHATRVEATPDKDDREGVDYWIHRKRGRPLGVDVKWRGEDYAVTRKEDDYALERWWDIDRKQPGFACDPKKSTDYILYFWHGTDRWALIPFPMLYAVFMENMDEWMEKYPKIRTGSTGDYTPGVWYSQCVLVPRHVFWRAVFLKYSGVPT